MSRRTVRFTASRSSTLAASPLLGANSTETMKSAVAASTLSGPVGRLLPRPLTSVPTKPLIAPKMPDRTTITPSFSVQ